MCGCVQSVHTEDLVLPPVTLNSSDFQAPMSGAREAAPLYCLALAMKSSCSLPVLPYEYGGRQLAPARLLCAGRAVHVPESWVLPVPAKSSLRDF